MIVVVGQPYLRVTEEGAALAGPAARIAVAAAARGRPAQLVGTAGEDDAGGEVVLALARAGVGHVALLRKAGQQTPVASNPTPQSDEGPMDPLQELPEPVPASSSLLDAADVELALRYLTEYSVVVVADPANSDVLKVVADAAGWAGARLILVVPPGLRIPEGLPDDVIVFESPAMDPDGAFASFVGTYAAALDGGDDPGAAFRSSIEADGWEVTTGA